MSYMNEYIKKNFTAPQLENELLQLISQYNKKQNTFLLIFYTTIEKPLPAKLVMLSQDDFYTINDLICKKDKLKSLDIFIESPGGRGETAKDLADLFHNCSEKVNFIICGEAKSAATILALSGHEISMTRTGSIGPIDAQVTITNRTVSAFNYKQWIENVKEEAIKNGYIDLVDNAIITQIIPGELLQVLDASDFAKQLVVEWLPKYKFKDWKETKTRKIQVTEEYKIERAKEIADQLESKEKWKLHQMSIKAADIKDLLQINDLDANPDLSEILYRIHTVCRMLCFLTNTYKIYATEEYKIFKQSGVEAKPQVPLPFQQENIKSIKIDTNCPKCGTKYIFYGKFINDPLIDEKMKAENAIEFPKDNKFLCTCGFVLNLIKARSDIEKATGKKIL